VKGLSENDWVIPMKPNLGMWRSLAGEGWGSTQKRVLVHWLPCGGLHAQLQNLAG
jgi:hypothetical protein